MKLIKSIGFYFLQFTWGLPQNLIGGILYLLLRMGKESRQERFHYAFIIYAPMNGFSGITLGLFIFVNTKHSGDADTMNDIFIHEYGHTVQSLFTGPLYLLVIGLVSIVWALAFAGYRAKHNVSYSRAYCEGWANLLGLRWTKGQFLTQELLERGRYGKPI